MGLLRRLFRREKKPPLLERLVFAAAGGAVSSIMNSDAVKNMNSAPIPAVQTKPLSKIEDYDREKKEREERMAEEKRAAQVMSLLAEIALCYYIAGVDGMVSQDEYRELQSIKDTFNRIPNVKPEERAILGRVTDPHISFVQVCEYLDKLDRSTLISYAVEMEKVAESDNDISPREKDAIQLYKDYVTTKTGYVFSKVKSNEDVKEVELVCPRCSGELDLDMNCLRATCRFCGYTKILDANRIDEAMDIAAATERIKQLVEEDKQSN